MKDIVGMGKLLTAILILISGCVSAQVPFHRGVNFTNWFQSPSAAQIKFSKFTKKDFEDVKSLGCDVVRLPINLHFMTSGAPDYTLDSKFLSYLDQAVTWAEDLNIHLILDNHTFDPAVGTNPNIGEVLIKVWTQMALHYKDKSALIYYEVLN
ncbi:MAG TPA: cellulase family glycosylhydrolase, partial [Cyclobacteriaceae bacterium]